MSGFYIDIKNDDFEDKLEKMSAEVARMVQDELNFFGLETVAMAKSLVESNHTVNFGLLVNGITFDPLPQPQIGVELISAMNYSAYIEFGTGIFAAAYVPSLPQEIQAYAKTFFVNGKGRIHPKPFLFPSIEANTIKLIERLKTVLNA